MTKGGRMQRWTALARTAPALAWSLAGVALVGIGVAFIGALLEPVGDGRIEALWVLSWVGFPVVGAVVGARRPGNRVGWLLLGMGFGIGVGLLAESYALLFGVGPDLGSVPVAVWWAVAIVGFHSAFGFIPLLVLYFPDGRPGDRVATWLTRTFVTLLTLNGLAWLVRADASVSGGAVFPNPLAPPVLGDLADAATGPLGTTLVGCAVGAIGLAVVHYRRSTGVERLQRRWFAVAAVALPALLLLGLLIGEVDERIGDVAFYVGWVLGLNGIAVAIGIAVLRHRLYEIDRVVSRTVTYAVVTAALVAVYATIVVLPSALFALESDLLVAAATLAAAGLFLPLRRRVQALVDRRFNRSHYDASMLVERFGVRVRHELEPDDVTADLRDVVIALAQPAHLSVWVPGGHHVPAGDRL